MNRVTAIIPTYNRRLVLQRALKSVYGQTRPPDEVIVVDDGSDDDTETFVRRHYPKARYVFQSNKGVSAARNQGIRLAESEWIALLDSDDEWLPEKLEKQLAQLDAQPDHKLCHSDEIWIRHGKRVNPMKKHTKTGGWIFERCLPLCAISPSSSLIHRSLFDELGDFDESLPACEDYDLWLRICARYPVLFNDQPLLVKYGGHADQLSRKYWGMDRYRITALQKILNQDVLSPDQRLAAQTMLLKKLKIYINGAIKRGRQQEAEQYRAIARQYQEDGNLELPFR